MLKGSNREVIEKAAFVSQYLYDVTPCLIVYRINRYTWGDFIHSFVYLHRNGYQYSLEDISYVNVCFCGNSVIAKDLLSDIAKCSQPA